MNMKMNQVIVVPIAVLLPLGAVWADGPTVGFAPPVFVSRELGGGEPIVLADHVHHTLIYSSHEGTTLLFRDGLASPTGDIDFGANYRNQVNLFISSDDGETWQRINWNGTGFATDPLMNTGFSDPDLTQDDGGRVYGTGIDLANDSLFSSSDGGRTWDRGTLQCHDGDRPWLAGGRLDEVFLATDTIEGEIADPSGIGHTIFRSQDGGQTCDTTGIVDYGSTADGGSYSGLGKLHFDRAKQRLIEPEVFFDKNGTATGIGVGTWSRGDNAFTPHRVAETTVHNFQTIGLDSADNVYLVWATDPRKPNTDACRNGEPLANELKLSVSRDFGTTWSQPVTFASPGTRVFWPWIVGGDVGKIAVVWYETDSLVDEDCESSNVSIHEATIFGAQDPANRSQISVDVVGHPIHTGSVCQAGTICLATGQDHRLGDYLTDALDERGCVIVASGDTELKDPATGGPLPTSRPIFIRQDAGPALEGGGSCGLSQRHLQRHTQRQS
jgi:hypothetical protein